MFSVHIFHVSYCNIRKSQNLAYQFLKGSIIYLKVFIKHDLKSLKLLYTVFWFTLQHAMGSVLLAFRQLKPSTPATSTDLSTAPRSTETWCSSSQALKGESGFFTTSIDSSTSQPLHSSLQLNIGYWIVGSHLTYAASFYEITSALMMLEGINVEEKH